jgi:hypothetical protein
MGAAVANGLQQGVQQWFWGGGSVLLASTQCICQLVALVSCGLFLHIVQAVAAVYQVLCLACFFRQAGKQV